MVDEVMHWVICTENSPSTEADIHVKTKVLTISFTEERHYMVRHCCLFCGTITEIDYYPYAYFGKVGDIHEIPLNTPSETLY